MIGIIHIPDGLGSFGLIGNGDAFGIEHRCTILILFGWGFHRGCEQHGAKDAASAARPPFAHLVDGLAGIALQPREALTGTMGKSTSRQVFGRFAIGEIGDADLDCFPEIWRTGLLFDDAIRRNQCQSAMPADVQCQRREDWAGRLWMSCASS